MCKHLPSYKDLFVYMSVYIYIYVCIYIHITISISISIAIFFLSPFTPPHLQDETENLKSRVVPEVVMQPLMNV